MHESDLWSNFCYLIGQEFRTSLTNHIAKKSTPMQQSIKDCAPTENCKIILFNTECEELHTFAVLSCKVGRTIANVIFKIINTGSIIVARVFMAVINLWKKGKKPYLQYSINKDSPGLKNVSWRHTTLKGDVLRKYRVPVSTPSTTITV